MLMFFLVTANANPRLKVYILKRAFTVFFLLSLLNLYVYPLPYLQLEGPLAYYKDLKWESLWFLIPVIVSHPF